MPETKKNKRNNETIIPIFLENTLSPVNIVQQYIYAKNIDIKKFKIYLLSFLVLKKWNIPIATIIKNITERIGAKNIALGIAILTFGISEGERKCIKKPIIFLNIELKSNVANFIFISNIKNIKEDSNMVTIFNPVCIFFDFIFSIK